MLRRAFVRLSGQSRGKITINSRRRLRRHHVYCRKSRTASSRRGFVERKILLDARSSFARREARCMRCNLFPERQNCAVRERCAMFINTWDYLSLTRHRLSLDALQPDIYMRILNRYFVEIFQLLQIFRLLQIFDYQLPPPPPLRNFVL